MTTRSRLESRNQHEAEGIRAVPDDAEPWMTRLQPPHPPEVARAAGALMTVTASRVNAFKAAYTLADAGLLLLTQETHDPRERMW